MRNKILYLECKSGISGDMTVAALLDLGVDESYFNNALGSLHLEGVRWEITRVDQNGIMACDFNVILQDTHEHHNHDHGHGIGKKPEHDHRNLHDIYAIIERGKLTSKARDIARRIFAVVAEAEAKVHGKSMEEVHFHEVGALDSIIDIVGAAVCLDYLGIERVAVSSLHEGSGFVTCMHGRLPVPVPAVVEIATQYKMAFTMTDCPHELVTPTGIAIAAAIRTEAALPANMVIHQTGHGAGKRTLQHANILRAMLVEKTCTPDTETIWVLESNVDDSTGEQLGYAMEAMLKAGALDVHYLPAFMKKNRPGWLLRVITKADNIAELEKTIYNTTTTIGIRRQMLERTSLKREIITVRLPCGEAKVKKCFYGESVFYYPEHESIRALIETSGMDYKTLADEIRCAARSL